MMALDAIVEQRIGEAQARGEFDDLPGAGAPLELEDDALVPEDLRVAYRILKNSGFLPPELEARREIHEIEQLLSVVAQETERARLLARIEFLLSRRSAAGSKSDLRVEQAYREQLAQRLESRRGNAS